MTRIVCLTLVLAAQTTNAPSYDWIDPTTEPPNADTLYRLYDTPVRGEKTQASYLVFLPKSYATSPARRYPVIYYLHGGFGYSRDGSIAILPFAAAMATGKMPEAIVVVPQALPSGWYCNSKDGARPVEDVIVKNLVPHIDATYRTIARPQARALEGMSMGGYGALHLGFKYPEVFGVISAVAPAVRDTLADEPAIRTADTFFGDEAYFQANSPLTLAKTSSTKILAAKTVIRVLSGTLDDLKPFLDRFDKLLVGLGIPHTIVESQGARHDYTEILAKYPGDPYAFWKSAFAKL